MLQPWLTNMAPILISFQARQQSILDPLWRRQRARQMIVAFFVHTKNSDAVGRHARRCSSELIMRLIALAAYVLTLAATASSTHAESVVIGVNVPYLDDADGKASRIDQEIATLKELKAAGVRVIRAGIAADQTGLDFAKRIHDEGLKLHWELGLQYAANARQRPWRPHEFPNVWAQYPLSMADPDRFRASFQPRLSSPRRST